MNLSGRKKGGGRATEAADTLRSTQIAEVAIAVSEGPCVGPVNGLKSVYLDGVPVENADGSRNFADVQFAFTLGTQGQAALPGLNAVQSVSPVGVRVDQAQPVVRTITNPQVDAVRIVIGVPQLTQQDAGSGDLKGASFEFTIEVQSAGGGFVEKHRATVEGKTMSRYTRAVRVELTGAAPWDVRVRRISADSTSALLVNAFDFDSYTAISTVKLRYPHTAMSFLRVNAQTFGAVPVQAIDWMGRELQVPVNYDPLANTYAGVWNGTFKAAWSNNPAWVFYLFATQPRFGLGQFVPAELLNKWKLYTIGQYSDGMVSDGRGGMEPRFTCNAYIQTRQEAYALLRELASVFRGMVYWAASSIEFAQDAPGDAELLFTPANVADGLFNYADTSERATASVFIVNWHDQSQFGKVVPEVYVDEDLVARVGVRERTFAAFGCTSRGQAARVARWAAYTERHESEAVQFAVGSDGAIVTPGRLFKIADPAEAGERLGGRISAATAASITLDAPVTLASGESYSLSVLQPVVGDDANMLAQARTVVTVPGTHQVLQVSPPFDGAPAAGTVWLLESNAVEATWWRCVDVTPVEGKPQWRMTAVRHHPGKHAAVEAGLKLDERHVSRMRLQPPAPASVVITEKPYLTGTTTKSRVVVSWPAPLRSLTYLVSWRLAGGPWNDMPASSSNSVEIDGLARGEFDVTVRSLNGLGNPSRARKGSQVLLGKVARPPNVAGFTATLVQGGVQLRWTPNPEADALMAEVRVGGADWASATFLHEGGQGDWFWAWPAQGSHTLRIKHFDTSLNESLEAATAAVDVTAAVYTQWEAIGGRPTDSQLLRNLLDAGGWAPGTTGTQGEPGRQWVSIGNAGEDSVILAPGPDGQVQPLWRCISVDATGTTGDGGWHTATVAIDPARAYRVAQWFQCAGVMDGSFYLGIGSNTVRAIGGALADNPYFIVQPRDTLVVGRWYLALGYVMPANYAGAQLGMSGLWDGVTGEKIATGIDWQWPAGMQATYQRTYLFYASVGAEQLMAAPEFLLVDGSEGTVISMGVKVPTGGLAPGAVNQVFELFDAAGVFINPAA